MKKKIFLGADHAGFELKEHIKRYLQKEGYEIEDLGAKKYLKSDDYPDFIIPAARKVAKNKGSMGIIFGGSGQGEQIAANKVKGIRAALYYGKSPEIIELARTHNDANILSIGARFVSKEEAVKAVKMFLSIPFDNEKRHLRRISKIRRFEK